jgi:hypothetical protein
MPSAASAIASRMKSSGAVLTPSPWVVARRLTMSQASGRAMLAFEI